MPRVSEAVNDEYAQRLYNAAEAFYFAGVLTTLPFDAANAAQGGYELARTADAAIGGPQRHNQLGAPPIANFGFSIELYIKLLLHLTGLSRVRGHDLHALFVKLKERAPDIASRVMEKHHYARGDCCEFLSYLKDEARAFEKWRYAHEEEFLCSSPETLFTLANAFRDAISELYPDLTSVFRQAHRSHA
ncbi:MAG: hypothetical protein JO270_00765 [Acidobacteriaceae bacterium]|nr:hypothetical protein [Acidobacteriaceae bacterium]